MKYLFVEVFLTVQVFILPSKILSIFVFIPFLNLGNIIFLFLKSIFTFSGKE